jgi:transcriptional regulator with XRE-family HTH domain
MPPAAGRNPETAECFRTGPGNGSTGNGVAGHFGRQVRRDRLAHGWSITELSVQTGINAAHLSRIENGRRPPTARIADALDKAFPERRGWYLQWFDDIRTAPEIPATFRSWSDYEEKSATLRAWMPVIIDGLAQTEDYAAAQIATEPGIDAVGRTRACKRAWPVRNACWTAGNRRC